MPTTSRATDAKALSMSGLDASVSLSSEPASVTRRWRSIGSLASASGVRAVALLFAVLALAGAAGCGSNGIHVAANASQLLHGRRLAIGLGSTGDIWVLDHGRLVPVSRKVREARGYQQVDTFSLSPDGEQIAYFLSPSPMMGFGQEAGPSPALIVSRADGTQAHEVAAKLGICDLCSYSTPSWDRNSRSFVIATDGLSPTSQIFRIAARSGKVTKLTPPGLDNDNKDSPAVSPNGREIAFLASAGGPPPVLTARSLVYVMRADGRASTRLPLPPRPYVDLWWCGNSTTLCVDSGTWQLAPRENAYRIDLRTGKVTHLLRWAEARYADLGGLSANGTFAIDERATNHGTEFLVGALNRRGSGRFASIVVDPHGRRDVSYEVSVSGP